MSRKTYYLTWSGGGQRGTRRSWAGMWNTLSRTLILTTITLLLLLYQVPSSRTQRGQSSQPTLIFANRQDIRLLDFYFNRGASNNPRGNSSIVVRELIEATALDIHYEYGLVCWSDIEQEKIKCSSFDPSVTSAFASKLRINQSQINDKITVVPDALPAPEDLVCDFITAKLYWSDSENNRIEVASMAYPYQRKVLIWEEIDQPRGLALAPHVGLMFWSDWGEYPKIERADMDGRKRQVIVDKNIFWPNGIALDLENKHLFWVDAKLLYIARIDFDGGNRKTLNQGAVLHPFALAFYAGILYWSDWNTSNLNLIRADGKEKDSRPIVTSAKQKLTPMDLVIFEEQKTPAPIWAEKYSGRKNPCDVASCSDLCLLTSQDPYYSCACPIGIKLLDGSRTQCSKSINNFLLVARGNDIRRISLDTEDYTDVILNVSGIKHVLAVDYHVKSGFMFWTDDEATGIRKAKLDGSEQQDVVKEEIVHPDGLAVDWVAENLYWTDAGTDRIEVSRLNGKNRKILISRGLQEPRAISVDPMKGFLFWSDWGKKAKIERSYLDGSSRITLVNKAIYWPNGIALDLKEQKIYWSDAKTDKIEMVNYDGTDRRDLISDDLPHIFGFGLLGDFIYWTDWQRRTLERANKRTGSQRTTIKDPFTDPMGLIGVNIEDKSHNLTNPCSKSNAGCQHLCLYRGESLGSVCACASGYEVASDNRSCLVPDAFLVFSRDGDLHRISLNRTDSNNFDDIIPVSKVKAASALDFDTIESRIYWSDTKVKAICRAYMNGSETERIIEFGLVHPEGIAVDWLSRNIYWSDMGRHRIEVAKLNGAHRRTVLWSDIESPRGIALHPAKGLIYFALWRNSNPSIETAALDGSRRSVFIDRDIGRANGLTIDFEQSFIYWTDIDSLVIEKASLEDRSRQVIQRSRERFQPSSLAQYQDYIYWSDLNTQSIFRANKTRDSTPVTLVSASNIVDMAIYHNLKQQGWNPCSVASCSHLCFSVPADRKDPFSSNQVKSKCGCPTHYTLSSDGNNCSPPQDFLLFSAGSTVSRLVFDTSECPDAIVIGGQEQKQRGISAVAWDSRDRNIFWVDPKSSNIKRASENGSGATSLLNAVDENFKPFDVAFDEVRRLLYWSCENFNSINVSDSTGRSIGSMVSSSIMTSPPNSHYEVEDKYASFRPRHLALNVLKSHLYFSNDGRIERIRLDGMDRIIISNSGSSISGLAIDVNEGLLYWTDSGPKRIETADLDGNNRKVLVAGLDSPSSIAVMGRYVYWIEERSGVERVDKWTGDERQRVLPRIDNAKYITFVNESLNLLKDQCRSLHCSHVCIEGECSCFEGFVLSFEDQQTCIPRSPCVSHEFSCLRGRVGCIPLPLKCDGKFDCWDKSDEIECEPCEFTCPCDGACFRTKCLSVSQICNGHEDCFGTGWDESEEACAKIAPPLPHSTSLAPITTSFILAIIFILVIVGALIFWCRKNRSIRSEESSEPLNHPGTNMTTIHTADTLRQFPSTNNSSSMGSSPYCELLGPRPSPETGIGSFCCPENYAVSYYRSEPVPPPTPCSTDVCDNSEYYGRVGRAPPPSSYTSSPHSTIRSLEGGGTGGRYAPPPSPNLT